MSDAHNTSVPIAADEPTRSGTGGVTGITEDTISTPSPSPDQARKTVVRPGDRILSSLASGSAVLI